MSPSFATLFMVHVVPFVAAAILRRESEMLSP